MEKRKEEIMKFVFLLAACASIATVAMICLFLFANGLPTIGKIGAADFFLGERWRPANGCLRHSADDPGQLVRYAGSDRRWSSGRDFDGCLYGAFLS